MSHLLQRACTALPLALICAGVHAEVPAPDRCVVGESAFGCRSERDVAQITSFRGDADELKEKIAADVASGECRMFIPGERVFLTSVAADAERAAVRRPGDTVSYWMPASWSRPATECAAYATRRSLREKLGLAATTQAEPPEPGPDVTRARQPPPPQPVPAECTIKAVMTDAEIALCRNLKR